MDGELIDISHRANDSFCELGNKLDIAKEYLQGIMNMCDGMNEDHAQFYYVAREALQKIAQKTDFIDVSTYNL